MRELHKAMGDRRQSDLQQSEVASVALDAVVANAVGRVEPERAVSCPTDCPRNFDIAPSGNVTQARHFLTILKEWV